MNQHGLNRYIPKPVRREVRQRCGFGCVFCGSAIYDFEHFSPEFKDALIHDPAGITLLCPSCHSKKTRGWITGSQVAAANASPMAIQAGGSHEIFLFGEGTIHLQMGSVFMDAERGLFIDGFPILRFRRPEEAGRPLLMSAVLTDLAGRPMIRIEDNEWRVSSENWDVVTEGNLLRIWSQPREISLALRFQPPHLIQIEACQLRFNRKVLKVQGDEVMLNPLGSDRGAFLKNVQVIGFEKAISWH